MLTHASNWTTCLATGWPENNDYAAPFKESLTPLDGLDPHER